ncbi:hypothetical protein BP5796_06330 [Coleophoma crateriformis]|uniref:Uncharacterized protein n=1 Tax=Coleophoma crateriformis TaxID=565419 RepID=A0A3D8RWU8_9HELO|nr:hypothetical protein BP5796_06330 [Coleophoma crateriformis]
MLYALCATSWLLYWVFAAVCYEATFLTCLFQFDAFGHFARKSLRKLLKQLQFIDDKIAFFNIPALEIDTEVDGLMVIRGVTVSLSNLSLTAHGVEVGIKLSDDLEVAIQTEEVVVSLFRKIEIGDCFANLKGGQYEMTFGELDKKTKDNDGDALLLEGTPLLKAASRDGTSRTWSDYSSHSNKNKMKNVMTDGTGPKDSSTREALESTRKITLDTKDASRLYYETLKWLKETNSVHESRLHVKRFVTSTGEKARDFDHTNENAMRAAICSQLHSKPSVPHPPKRSIKVTTLQNLMPLKLQAFVHRLPMLYRLMLNPLSYFHPVRIESITATASGKWIEHTLAERIFKHYGEQDSEIRNLEKKVAAWLSDANFAVELGGILGLAQVPFLTHFDINCLIGISDVIAYRSLPEEVGLKQVVRLGGADATFTIPSFLLPHHEHIVPPVPTQQDRKHLEQDVEIADGKPKTLQAQNDLRRAEKDEANVKMAIHARLPACLDQELLDFISALIKASKIVEMEKEPNAMDQEIHGIKEFSNALNRSMRDGMKKAVVGGIVNDKWIAKMVGKITKKLETAQGDLGYSGDIPVALTPYRPKTKEDRLEKLLP